MNGDNLCNRLGSDRKCVVGLAKGIENGQVGIDLAQALVVDDEECVDVLRHLFHAIEGLVDFLWTFEAEGNGDDTHGEDAKLLRHFGNDWCSTRSGATTHTSGDERHARSIAEHIANVVDALLRCHAGLLGLVACTEPLLAQLQMHGHGRVVECLVVGVAKHEGDIVDAFAIHVVHGIATAATHADNFNNTIFFFGLTEIKYAGSIVVYNV